MRTPNILRNPTDTFFTAPSETISAIGSMAICGVAGLATAIEAYNSGPDTVSLAISTLALGLGSSTFASGASTALSFRDIIASNINKYGLVDNSYITNHMTMWSDRQKLLSALKKTGDSAQFNDLVAQATKSGVKVRKTWLPNF